MGSVSVDFFAAACAWLAERRGHKAVGPEGGPTQQLIMALGEAEQAWRALPELQPCEEETETKGG